MDAEAAALAMAEAAFHEAAERERGDVASMPDAAGAMDTSSMYSYTGGNETGYEQQQIPAGVQQFMGQDAELLQNLMSMPDDESRNQFLQSLLQQEQEIQLKEAARMRPQTHHLTISREGKDWSLFFRLEMVHLRLIFLLWKVTDHSETQSSFCYKF